MSTLLLTHPSGLDHDTGQGHPERPDRLRAINTMLEDAAFDSLIREEAPAGIIEDITRAHPKTHYDLVEHLIPGFDYHYIDGDTVLCSNSWEAILRSAGAGVAAVDKVMSGDVKNAFCALRPPGHHAEKTKAMGFCFFNNIAVAAHYAKAKHNCERVAIIDFDVHHGNGTQDIFWDEPSVFYGSTHEMPLYPGSGSKSETGAGNIFNAPLPAGSGGNIFKEALEGGILKPLETFKPDFVFISAGFDAHIRDPLSTIALVEDDFAWATQKIMDLADRHCEGRVVSMLEGGYDLEGLAQSLKAHMQTLMKS